MVVDLYESYDYEDGSYTYASIAEFEVDGHKYLVKDCQSGFFFSVTTQNPATCWLETCLKSKVTEEVKG